MKFLCFFLKYENVSAFFDESIFNITQEKGKILEPSGAIYYIYTRWIYTVRFTDAYGRLIAADGNVCLLMLMLCKGSSGEIPAASTQKQKEKQQQQPTKRLHHHVAWILCSACGNGVASSIL
jgi:hypothetical protein